MYFRCIALTSIVALLLSMTVCRPAAAAEPKLSLYSLTEENDGIFSGQDRHYTQGLMFSRMVVPAAGSSGFWDELSRRFASVTRVLGAGSATAGTSYRWPIIGQSLFTPADLDSTEPQPDDRPFAAWLYVGAGLQRRTVSGRVDQFQLLAGVVGPWALGEVVQEKFHKVFDYKHARGWDNQLHNEPGLVASYQTRWTVPVFDPSWIDIDLQPQVGLSVGNVLTYGEIGLTLRFGQGSRVLGSPRTITPGLSGSGWFDPGRIDGAFDWMMFVGIQTRAVWRNLFLQGNSFRHSASVDKRDFVTDEEFGVSLLFRPGVRVDVIYVKRSHEFVGQHGDDRFGSITVSVPLQ